MASNTCDKTLQYVLRRSHERGIRRPQSSPTQEPTTSWQFERGISGWLLGCLATYDLEMSYARKGQLPGVNGKSPKPAWPPLPDVSTLAATIVAIASESIKEMNDHVVGCLCNEETEKALVSIVMT